ncbi:hypothetical protein ACFXTN_037971 [Malus domestica]
MASFTQPEDDSVPATVSTRPFDDDSYLGYDPRLSSQRFDSESLKDSATDSLIFHGSAVDDAFAILSYLKGTIDSGLWFKPGNQFLTAWSDADWAGCPVDRRSTSGYCVFLGPNLISWSAKKQTTMARSSTEAEYRSLANTAAEITWVCKILQDLSFPLLRPPMIFCDNQSAIALAKNPVFHARTKHVEIDYHYIREKVLHDHISIHHVPTLFQIADIFTKSLFASRFATLSHKLSVCSPPFSLRGCVKDTE